MTAVFDAQDMKRHRARSKQLPPNPFVRRELSREEKDTLRARVSSGWDVWEALNLLIQSEYKLTLGWDDYSNSPVCFLFPKSEKDPNFGRILTGRGRTLQGAVYEACFKHFILFDRVWPGPVNKADEELWDD